MLTRSRFILEFLRDTPKDAVNLSHGQLFSIIAIMISIGLLFVLKYLSKREIRNLNNKSWSWHFVRSILFVFNYSGILFVYMVDYIFWFCLYFLIILYTFWFSFGGVQIKATKGFKILAGKTVEKLKTYKTTRASGGAKLLKALVCWDFLLY